MRKIKFRGKRVDNGEWVYGYLVNISNRSWIKDINNNISLIRLAPDYADIRCAEIDIKTVGQYTGLKDKNGVEIYEGDIIAYADDLAHRMYLESLARSVPNEYYDTVYDEQRKIGLVEYCAESGYPAFDLTGHDSEYNMLSELQIGYITENGEYWYEVIGNIYENPELLEV